MNRPALFIGSSSEGLEIARSVRQQLSDVAEITLWHEGPFGLSQGYLASLLAEAKRIDFAVLVLSADDLVTSRDEIKQSPRDNVLFECGVFMGRLGPRRTFLLRNLDQPLKIPSDLAGISIAEYRGSRTDGNLLAAIGSACDPIRSAIRSLGPADSGGLEEIEVGADRLWISTDSRGWLRPVQIRQLAEGVGVRIGTTELQVRYGQIQHVHADDSTAVVLPANEYFDDECVHDPRSALGAFAQCHFADRIELLQQAVREHLANYACEEVPKRDGLAQLSYGAGTCVYLRRPLGSDYHLILAAVTTERARIGLRAEISFVVTALAEVVRLALTHRISNLCLPLMGAGHGGLRPEVSLFAMILGLADALRCSGRALNSAEIVVYRDVHRERVDLTMDAMRRVVATAAGILN